MDRGKYTGRRVDFSKLAAACFNPYLFCAPRRAHYGCGASALALLTGIAPEQIAKEHGPSEHFSDNYMVRYLRKHGFQVERITMCRMSEGSQLSLANVVLLSQLVLKNEGTWGVLYDRLYYHNFDLYAVDHLAFLNKPVLSAHAVFHPRWRAYPPLREDSPVELPAAVSQQVQTGHPRRCGKCGGLIADRDRTTCTCKLLRAEVGKGQQFVFTTRELRQIIATLRRAR
jgi:hypothetical protein